GYKVGILGRTGCGKTTMVDLLLHMYNIEKGMITIDGVDLMEIDLHNLRQRHRAP
ncbi:MAG: ATP-binding cassette domain-containing protein, partial [Clostridia bacterium]|nr:ATP-binding cassette domain-containing protein [Clostridia bacterium]